jgi:hypothetical protein
LIASPEVAYELACRVSNDEATIKQVGWRVERVPEWNDDALYFHLEENVQVRDDALARLSLLDATGGFGLEIERISSNALSIEQAISAVKENEVRLAPDLATFYRKVGVPEAVSAEARSHLERALPDVDGAVRSDASVSEWLKDCGVEPGLFLFATWMGLVQPSSDGKWKVPHVYKRLLG